MIMHLSVSQQLVDIYSTRHAPCVIGGDACLDDASPMQNETMRNCETRIK